MINHRACLLQLYGSWRPPRPACRPWKQGKRSAGHLAAFRRINGMGAPDSGGFGRKQMNGGARLRARGTAFSARSLLEEGQLPPEGLASTMTGKKSFPVEEASQRTGFLMSEGFPCGSRRIQQRMSQQTKEFPTKEQGPGNRRLLQAVKHPFPPRPEPFRKEARSPMG